MSDCSWCQNCWTALSKSLDPRTSLLLLLFLFFVLSTTDLLPILLLSCVSIFNFLDSLSLYHIHMHIHAYTYKWRGSNPISSRSSDENKLKRLSKSHQKVEIQVWCILLQVYLVVFLNVQNIVPRWIDLSGSLRVTVNPSKVDKWTYFVDHEWLTHLGEVKRGRPSYKDS